MRKNIIWSIIILLVVGWIASGSLIGLLDSLLGWILHYVINAVCITAPILIVVWVFWKMFKG